MHLMLQLMVHLTVQIRHLEGTSEVVPKHAPSDLHKDAKEGAFEGVL